MKFMNTGHLALDTFLGLPGRHRRVTRPDGHVRASHLVGPIQGNVGRLLGDTVYKDKANTQLAMHDLCI